MQQPFAITIKELNALNPCADADERVRVALRKFDADKSRAYSAAEARAAWCAYSDIIWAASAIAMGNEDVARRLTGFLNDNAKRVLHIFEEVAPDDTRVRDCIKATDTFLAGEIGEGEWKEDAWDAWAGRAAEFHAWQFDRLIEWLSPEAPKPLPMPERMCDLEEA